MKASQLSKMTQSAMSFTKAVTTRWNDRLAGSKACLACADFLEESLAAFCDKTDSQVFSVSPGVFLGYICFIIVILFLALIELFF